MLKNNDNGQSIMPDAVTDKKPRIYDFLNAIGAGIYYHIYQYIRTYQYLMFGAILLGVIASFASISAFYLVFLVVWHFINGSLSASVLYDLGWIGIAMAVLYTLSFSLSTAISHYIAAHVQYDLRLKFGQKIKAGYPWAFSVIQLPNIFRN